MKVENNTLILDFDKEGHVEGTTLYAGDIKQFIAIQRVLNGVELEQLVPMEKQDNI